MKKVETTTDKLGKIKRSALVALGGAALLDVPIMTKELIDFISNGDPFDWRTPLIVLISTASTWVVNTIKVYVTEDGKKKV